MIKQKLLLRIILSPIIFLWGVFILVALTFDYDSMVRKLAKQYFGGESLLELMFVSYKLLPVITQRMERYSPHIST
ncbi:MAG: hypothetical protein ACOCVF_01300 [bacterium]